MFCPQCGERLADGVKFCKWCGASVQGRTVPAGAGQSAAAEAAVASRPKVDVAAAVAAPSVPAAPKAALRPEPKPAPRPESPAPAGQPEEKKVRRDGFYIFECLLFGVIYFALGIYLLNNGGETLRLGGIALLAYAVWVLSGLLTGGWRLFIY